MINCLIFTKDRACQLDLLLRSINEFFLPRLDIHILAKATNSDYEDGYDKFLNENKNFHFYWEKPNLFKNQVMGIVHRFNYDHTICFLDDDVVVNTVPYIGEAILNDKQVNALSLRMSPKINYCYAKDIGMEIPKFVEQEEYLIWDWTKQPSHLDWGYPMSLGGNIYSHYYLFSLWDKIFFDSPNYIEGYMHLERSTWHNLQACFKEQKVYNVANNLVQTVCKNRFQRKNENSPKQLNEKYLDGYHIDLKTICNKRYNSANGPARYKLIKEN